MRGVSTKKGGAEFVGKMMPSQFQNIVDVCVLCMILGGDQLFGWLTGWVYNSDENLYNQGVPLLWIWPTEKEMNTKNYYTFQLL